jgi:hsp70-interacting protein
MPSDYEAAESASPGIHTPASPSALVHDNSHASMLRDPSYISTSGVTVKALEEGGLLKALFAAIISPVPHGKDGDSYGDAELEKSVIQ